MRDPNENQGRNRPATTSEKRISAAFCVILAVLLLWWIAGCTVVNEHKAPPADWPKLEVTVTEGGFWEVQEKCERNPLVVVLIGPALGCASIDFDKMRCDIYLWLNSVLEHELLHCSGHDHYLSTELADWWTNWKKANGK